MTLEFYYEPSDQEWLLRLHGADIKHNLWCGYIEYTNRPSEWYIDRADLWLRVVKSMGLTIVADIDRNEKDWVRGLYFALRDRYDDLEIIGDEMKFFEAIGLDLVDLLAIGD